MRRLLIGAGLLIVLAVAAVAIAPAAIDWNGYKADIARLVEARTGRALAIDGDLDFRILPSPSFEATGLRLASIDGATFPDLVRLSALRATLRLVPLLSGRIDIESITLRDPVVELERLADGRLSWKLQSAPARSAQRQAGAQRQPGASGLPPRAPQDRAPQDRAPQDRAPVAQSGGSGLPIDPDSLSIERLSIENGTVIYRSPEGIARIEALDAVLTAETLAGPYRAKGTVRLRDVPVSFNAHLGAIRDDSPVALNLLAGLIGTASTLVVKGSVYTPNSDPRLEVGVSLKGDDFNAAALRIASLAGQDFGVPPAAFGRGYEIEAMVSANREATAVRDLEIRLGDASVTGSVRVGIADKQSFQIALKLAPLDLDRWLAQPVRATPVFAAGRAAPADSGAAASGGAIRPFVLPPDVSASIELGAEGIKYRGRRVRELRLAAALNDGEVTLNQASVRLPGGAEASAFGFLVARNGRPAFDGSLDARIDDLRAMLTWLGVELPDISSDRLRKLQLAGKIRADDREIQLADIKLRLDASRLKGGVTFALRERPAFGARFSVDQINLEAYLPRPPGGTRGGTRGGKPGRTGDAGETGAGPDRVIAAVLAALDKFDANLALDIGALTYRNVPVHGIAFDGTLVNGALTLRKARIRSLAGTALALTGKIDGLGTRPRYRGTIEAGSKNLTGLLRIAGVRTAVPAARLGRMKLSGTFEISAEDLVLDAKLALGGGELRLAGTASALATSPRIQAMLSASHPELARLARLGGVMLVQRGRRLGRVRLKTEIQGGLAALDLKTRLVALGGSVDLNGTLGNPIAAPRFAGSIAIAHPDFARLRRMIEPRYRPGRRRPGKLKLAAKLLAEPSAIRLAEIAASIGPATLGGSAALEFTGKRPKLVAALTAGKLPIDVFLSRTSRRRAPASPAALGAAARPGKGGRWDRKPLDLSALGAVDADIRLKAEAVAIDDFRIERLDLAATLADRVLSLTRLQGALFGGRLALDGTLDARKTPAVSFRVKIERAAVEAALLQAAGLDVLGGRLDLAADLRAKGKSEHALIGSLTGTGRLALADGAIKGVDLAAVGKRLGRVSGGLDLLALLGSALSGGKTPFERIQGTFEVRNGVLRTDDVVLRAKAASGEASGKIDLAAWTIDMNTSVALAEPAAMPPFGVRLSGPLDNPAHDRCQVAQGAPDPVRAGRAGGPAGADPPSARQAAPNARQTAPSQAATPQGPAPSARRSIRRPCCAGCSRGSIAEPTRTSQTGRAQARV